MKVIVFIKQIPDSSDVKLDENGNLIRSGVGTMINPVDKNALELGLALRDRFGGTVTAVTMGPPQAKDVLKRALFMGCDKAVSAFRPHLRRRRHPRNGLCPFYGGQKVRRL